MVVVVVAVVVVVLVLVLFLSGGGVGVVVVGVDVAAVAVVLVAVEVVVGGGAAPPFASTFMTGSGFLKTSLHGVQKEWGLGGAPHLQTLHLQTDSLYDDLKRNAITTMCLTQLLLMVRFSWKPACMV